MTKNDGEFNVAVISDIHLGAKRTDTRFILDNLYKAFPDNSDTAALDMLVFAGDVFDDLIDLSDDIVHHIDHWIVSVLRLCKAHDIVVRVLLGTPSHDWQMPARFATINEISQINCDLKYVKELSIEHIERFDIDVLYVPDEWADSTEKTLTQFKELLYLKGLKKVDYAFMHGAMPHQYPPHVKSPTHDPVEYLRLVDKLIFIGHVHTHSIFERIIAQGSFDRLAHGEEGAKGHVRARVRSSTDYDVTFIENLGARKYITIECAHLDLQSTLHLVETKLIDIPDGSAVRLGCHPDNPILTNMEQLTLRYPLITWSKIIRSDEIDEEKIQDESLDDDTFVPITITRENVSKLVLDRLEMKDTALLLFARAEQFLLELR